VYRNISSFHYIMTSIFKQMFEPELLKQIEKIPEKEVIGNEVLLRENAFIQEIPLVTEGSLKVRKTDKLGREIVLYHITQGESCILSIASCLNDKQSSAEAIVEGPSKIILIPGSKVRSWMDEFKSWRKFVLKLYYSRLDQLLSLVDGITFKQVDIRLYEKLRELYERDGRKILITHQLLAHELGTAREVVSRLLKKLEQNGIICLERGVIKILRPL